MSKNRQTLAIFAFVLIGFVVESAPLDRNETVLLGEVVNGNSGGGKNETTLLDDVINAGTEKADKKLTPTQLFNGLYSNITEAQKAVMGKFFVDFFSQFGDKHWEEKTVRMYGELKARHPDVFEIMAPAFDGVLEDYKGGDEVKGFLKSYYQRIALMKGGDDVEFGKFLDDVRVEWKKLSKDGQAEMAKAFGPTVQMINGE